MHKRDRNNIPITSMNEAIKEDLLKRGTFIFLQRFIPQRLQKNPPKIFPSFFKKTVDRFSIVLRKNYLSTVT